VSAPRGATGAPSDPGELERRLDYRFKDRLLLREALTHGSASGPGRGRRRTNERLEFLGDRVVGLAVAELLIRRYPTSPKVLSRRGSPGS
jgi:ribonuclease-3